MLSKSQARLLFTLSTAVFALIFFGLSYDSMQKVPAQTKTENMTDAVIRGHEIWTKNNCMGCHTLLGEGAYYAPELTKVYERRGAAWMKLFLKDPQAMFPGERKMVQYNFNDAEISDLIAYFQWIGQIDLNGFPSKPTIKTSMSAPANASDIAASAPSKFKEVCIACHSLGGNGGNVGPALDHVGSKFDAAYLTKWIADPQSVKPDTKMPQLGLSGQEQSEVVQFLASLK